ncbi:MAG: leucine-rich repeat domain-containing protein [Prevotella sp.]|nr:leucine-rich repeat domain-containing protein [Prevotella sp.]
MRKIKLLLLLTLLVVGVSKSWAARTYTVQYRNVPSGYTQDYQVTKPSRYYGEDSSGDDIIVLYTKNSSTSLTISTGYFDGSSFTQYNYSGTGYYDNPEWYIKPLAIDGYDATVTSSYNNRTITITYSPSSVVKWHDDVFEYSTRHTQSTGNVQDLTNDEVSISLWLGRNDQEFEEITDTIYFNAPLWNNASVGDSRTLPDYYNDDINATAEYKYLGVLPNRTPQSAHFFYLRKRTIAVSKVTNVVIPATAKNPNNNKTYKVTAIQKWGFCYSASDVNPRYSCSGVTGPNGEAWTEMSEEYRIANAKMDYGNLNDHRNDYLVNVRFESPSNVTQIGDYAFMSNKALKSIIVPSSVELLGQGVWECCRALTDLRFQTTTVTRNGETFEGVKFTTIQNFTFWFCTALETLVLPEGITTIEGASVGAPLQYMFSLIDLKLPNSLRTIGAHFVCCCNSLETLTIPAGVTDISGACFHGCESLKTVYLLGTASSLAGNSGGGNTFGENTIFCRDHVSGCKFYTTADYISSYAQGSTTNVWYKIADNRSGNYLVDENGNRLKDSNGNDIPVTGTADGYGNMLTIIQPEVREFVEGKWVTACFPTAIENYKAADKFGPGAIAAIMIDKTKYARTADQEQDLSKDLQGNLYTYAQGDDPYRYHVSFEEINSTTIPANTPILLLPGRTYEVPMMPNINMLTEEQKADLTVPRTVSVNASFTDRSETATITMISKYIDHQRLNVGDFYFISSGDKTEEGATKPAVIGSFKKVKDQAKAPYIGAFRCYWQVNIDNVVDVSAKSTLDMMSYLWDETDGVEKIERQPEIVIDGVYDLQGRKLNINQNDLPQGLYIVNGKKVVKK